MGRHLFLLIFFLNSCAGYHFKKIDNPLAQYEIESVAVPMFINRSIFPDSGAYLTKELTLSLLGFKGLKVVEGESEETDAVLIGIVESNGHLSEAIKTDDIFTEGKLAESIGERRGFYVPSSTSYTLNLRLILVKRPSKEDRLFIEGPYTKNLSSHPKIVLSEILPLTGSFTREVSDTLTSDSGGIVNATKNKGLFDRSLQNMAREAAKTFKEEVLDAF